MADNWGVIEELDEGGTFTAYHVVPMVDIDGEPTPSAAHQISDACPCHPFYSVNKHGCIVWQHHDPDHPGALPDSEFQARAVKAAEENTEYLEGFVN